MNSAQTHNTLYHQSGRLDEDLSIGWLRRQLIACTDPVWIALEPRASFPVQDGRPRPGRVPGLFPLLKALPDTLPDELPLLQASIFESGRWQHFFAAHPASGMPGCWHTWSLVPLPDSASVTDLLCKGEPVLTWQDRHRFALGDPPNWPASLQTEHYFREGRRLTWRLVP